MSDLRQGADRNVGRISQILADSGSDDLDLALVNRGNWLREAWQNQEREPFHTAYSAIVDRNGQIVLHSNPELEGGSLGREWYFSKLPQVGSNVVETDSKNLTAGARSVDLALPIYVADPTQPVGKYVGTYHVGLPLASAERVATDQIRHFLILRGVLFGGMLIVVMLAATSLYLLAERIATLRQVVTASVAEQANQLNRLAAGLAHEIRNPLHALRLNLHTFRRTRYDQSLLPEAEVVEMLDQSNREINRIDNLMNELASFASSEETKHDTFDLTAEVESIFEFLRHDLIRHDITYEIQRPQESVTVSMDSGKLRQILLNIIQNAIDAMPDGGKIDVKISTLRGKGILVVADTGRGVPEADRERIFEPFYSLKSDGTGLGLALVQRFVSEAGGTIGCQAAPSGGAAFRLSFPLSRQVGKP